MIIPVFGDKRDFHGFVEIDAEVFCEAFQSCGIIAVDGGSDTPEIFGTRVTENGSFWLFNYAQDADFLEKVVENLTGSGEEPFRKVQVFK